MVRYICLLAGRSRIGFMGFILIALISTASCAPAEAVPTPMPPPTSTPLPPAPTSTFPPPTETPVPTATLAPPPQPPVILVQEPLKEAMLRFSPDGNRLAYMANRLVYLWDATTGKKTDALFFGNTGKEAFVQDLVFSPDGNLLAGEVDFQYIVIWDTSTNQIVKAMDTLIGCRECRVSSLHFSADGRYIISSGSFGWVAFWDVQSEQMMFESQVDTQDAHPLGYSPDFKQVLIDNSPNADSVTLFQIMENQIGNPRIINGMAGYRLLSPDFKTLAVLKDKQLTFWDLESGTPRFKVDNYQNAAYAPEMGCPGDILQFSPDGKMLAAAGCLRPLQIYDVFSGQIVAQRSQFSNRIAFSLDGKYLASLNLQQQIELWQPGAEKAALVLNGLTAPPSSLEFAPGGQRIAAASSQELLIWELTGLP